MSYRDQQQPSTKTSLTKGLYSFTKIIYIYMPIYMYFSYVCFLCIYIYIYAFPSISFDTVPERSERLSPMLQSSVSPQIKLNSQLSCCVCVFKLIVPNKEMQ